MEMIYLVDYSMLIKFVLFKDNEPTLKERRRSSDAQEMRSFYKDYYKEYIQALQNAADKADR